MAAQKPASIENDLRVEPHAADSGFSLLSRRRRFGRTRRRRRVEASEENERIDRNICRERTALDEARADLRADGLGQADGPVAATVRGQAASARFKGQARRRNRLPEEIPRLAVVAKPEVNEGSGWDVDIAVAFLRQLVADNRLDAQRVLRLDAARYFEQAARCRCLGRAGRLLKRVERIASDNLPGYLPADRDICRREQRHFVALFGLEPSASDVNLSGTVRVPVLFESARSLLVLGRVVGRDREKTFRESGTWIAHDYGCTGRKRLLRSTTL